MPRCQVVHRNHLNHASREKRGRDPDEPGPAKDCPREAGTAKHNSTQRCEGHREAGNLTKQKLSQRSQDRNLNHTSVGEGPREPRTLRKKAFPEKPR